MTAKSRKETTSGAKPTAGGSGSTRRATGTRAAAARRGTADPTGGDGAVATPVEKEGETVPKARHQVDYGEQWDALVRELGNPLGGEPVHSAEPAFDQSNDDVYGPFVTDDCAVDEAFVPWPDDVSEELASVITTLRAPADDASSAEQTTQLPAVGELVGGLAGGLSVETYQLMIAALDATDADKVIARPDEETS